MRHVKDPDDENRCCATAADGGQCWNETVEDGTRCQAHGGRVNKLEKTKDYLVEQFERRLKLEGGDTDEIKLLKENLMGLNMMLSAHMNRIIDEPSLLTNSGKVAELLMKAEKVTVSLNRLQLSSGALLEKPALAVWGAKIVEAFTGLIEHKYDGWEDDLHEFADTVAGIIIQTKNVEEKK